MTKTIKHLAAVLAEVEGGYAVEWLPEHPYGSMVVTVTIGDCKYSIGTLNYADNPVCKEDLEYLLEDFLPEDSSPENLWGLLRLSSTSIGDFKVLKRAVSGYNSYKVYFMPEGADGWTLISRSHTESWTTCTINHMLSLNTSKEKIDGNS